MISELAKVMEVSRPSASNMVYKIAEKGLMKTKVSTKGGRICLLELTDKGKKVVEIKYWADMRPYEKTRVLYEEEFEVMERLFENIATGLDEEKV